VVVSFQRQPGSSTHYDALVSDEPQRGTGTLTELDERTDARTTECGDHDRFSHYVRKDKLTDAMVNGTPVIALCGKVWVPSRDPQRYPICPECKRRYELAPDA